MNPTLQTVGRLFLVLISLLVAATSPVAATVIGVPGNMPTNLPREPPSPDLPGFNNYPFMLSNVIAGPSPNPLPNGLFNETPLRFNLVLIAGVAQTGRVDPVVAPQVFNFFIIGDFWSVQAQFEYSPNTGIFHPSDVVTMTGDAVHRIAPHPGEFAPGPAIPFNVVLNAGSAVTLPADFDIPGDALRQAIRDANLPVGGRFGLDVRGAVHEAGSDSDVVFGILGGQIANPNNPFVGNNLEFWLGGVGGVHAPTPEPGTLLLTASTLIAVGTAARRWRRCRHRV